MKENNKKSFSIGILDFNSPVVLTFALICLVSLIFGNITGGESTRNFFCIYRDKFSFMFVVRLFTHVFGHANYNHFINNMMLFLIMGPLVEEKYGSKNLIEMIGITAVVTGLLNVWLSPNTYLLGASGVVFMLIVLSSATSLKEKKIPITLILVIFLYIGQQIVEGIGKTDNVSQFTHIVGGVLGAAFGFIYKKEAK